LQTAEHVDQLVQFLNAQKPQAAVLHGFDSVGEPHASPPFMGNCNTFRVLLLTPPPHSLLHVVQLDHPEILQLTGHFT